MHLHYQINSKKMQIIIFNCWLLFPLNSGHLRISFSSNEDWLMEQFPVEGRESKRLQISIYQFYQTLNYRRIERMMNTFNELSMQKFSKPPLRRDSKKYTMNTASLAKQEANSRSYRKIPNAIPPSSTFKQNIGTNPNAKSTRNIQFNLKESHVRKNSRSFLGKSQATQYMSNSCYVPREKEARSKSRWEMTQYHNNRNDYPEVNPRNPVHVDTLSPAPGLQQKTSSKTYLQQYSSIVTPSNYQYNPNYSNYAPNLQASSRVKDIQKSTEYSYAETNQGNNLASTKKSFKNIPFYQKIKSVNISIPSGRTEEQNYFNNTFSFSSTVSPRENSRCAFMAQSLGGSKYRQFYDSYDEKNKSILSEEVKSNYASSRLEKKISGKAQTLKQPQLDDFIIGPCKGEGRFGKVFMVIHKKTGFLCALKKVKKESVKYMIDQFIQQIKIQLFLNHPKLVKVYGYFSDAEHFYMLIQYMEDGSLYSLMKKNKKFQQPQAIQKLNEICQGIKQMHEHNIVHRDLKPENVVLSHGVCKICDFGWAAICQDRRQTYCGTLDYVCPEIIEGTSYDSSVDIWCIGVLAYELMCGKAPFYDISRKKTMQKIKSCKIESFPSHLSRKAVKFVEMILTKDVDSRVGIQELLESQFLRSNRK